MNIKDIKAKIKENEYYYSIHAEIERRADNLSFAQIEEALLNAEILEQYPDRSNMKNKRCNFCGSEQSEERKIEYLYGYQGKYLLVPNTPVEICLNCGMVYYEAAVLKEIERRFFAIQNKTEEPDRYISVPEKDFV